MYCSNATVVLMNWDLNTRFIHKRHLEGRHFFIKQIFDLPEVFSTKWRTNHCHNKLLLVIRFHGNQCQGSILIPGVESHSKFDNLHIKCKIDLSSGSQMVLYLSESRRSKKHLFFFFFFVYEGVMFSTSWHLFCT